MMANFSVPYQVTLGDLLPRQLGNAHLAKLPVCGLDNNSRSVEEGDVFFAYPGSSNDGRDYIDDAILRGASAVIYEAGESQRKDGRSQDCVDVNQHSVPIIPVTNLAQQLSNISARYFNQPAQAMTCIGITGTNGKTTCAYWLAQLLQTLGKKSGLVGTLGYQVFDQTNTDAMGVPVMQETGFTTPDAIRLQSILFTFKQKQVSHAVMEISSHSLDQGRVSSINFSTALFTNLSHDHLDYHGSMKSYGEAKQKLFQLPTLKHAVINLDDDFGKVLAKNCVASTIVTYSVSDTTATMFIKDMAMSTNGVTGVLVSPWGEVKFEAPVVGEFNVSNLLGVMGVLCVEGFAFPAVVDAVKGVQAPPGRLQRVSTGGTVEPVVFVDFAHTPDALEKILRVLREQTYGKLWCVFGCGGDRDRGKRPIMGDVVSRLADYCVVTSDNPRLENPQDILNEILVSMDRAKTVAIVDRKAAIQHAIASAKPGDLVLIAGKGHEAYQDTQGVKTPFSDVNEAQQALAQYPCAGVRS